MQNLQPSHNLNESRTGNLALETKTVFCAKQWTCFFFKGRHLVRSNDRDLLKTSSPTEASTKQLVTLEMLLFSCFWYMIYWYWNSNCFFNGSLSLLSKTTSMQTQLVPLSLFEVWENNVWIQVAAVVIFSRIFLLMTAGNAKGRGERVDDLQQRAQSRRFSQYPSRNPGSLTLRQYILGWVFQISQSKALGTF